MNAKQLQRLRELLDLSKGTSYDADWIRLNTLPDEMRPHAEDLIVAAETVMNAQKDLFSK